MSNFSKAPLISVIMGVYNDVEFIHYAMESILNQTIRDFEVIVIDDGSTDNTGAVVDAFGDLRIRIKKNNQHQGLTVSLNEAINISRGYYIARMDSDDLSTPTRFEEQLGYLESNPQLGMVGSWYLVIDERGKTIANNYLPDGNSIKQELMRWNPFCHGSVMIRRSALETVGEYRDEFAYAQDYDLWLRISEHYEVDNYPRFLYKWRLRIGNIATSKRWLQKRYRNLALACAIARRQGIKEPLERSKELELATPTLSEQVTSSVSNLFWFLRAKLGKIPIRFKV